MRSASSVHFQSDVGVAGLVLDKVQRLTVRKADASNCLMDLAERLTFCVPPWADELTVVVSHLDQPTRDWHRIPAPAWHHCEQSIFEDVRFHHPQCQEPWGWGAEGQREGIAGGGEGGRAKHFSAFFRSTSPAVEDLGFKVSSVS